MTYEEILSSLRRIIRALNIESKRIQKEFDVSIPQLLCLSYLQKSPGFQANSKEISNALNLNPSTITGIVKRLEKKGYLARLPKGDDKRFTYITLTESGAQLLNKTPKLFHEKLDERLSALSKDEVEKIQNGLDFIIELLGVEEVDAAPILTIGEDINTNVAGQVKNGSPID